MNVLVLRALGLGDLLTGVPALRAVRRHWPGARLCLATPAWLRPLVDLIGGIDEVLPQDGLDTPLRCSPRPDVAVNLHGRGPQSHRLLARCRPERLLALHPRGPRWEPEEHEVSRWCRMLAWYGIRADPDDLDLDADLDLDTELAVGRSLPLGHTFPLGRNGPEGRNLPEGQHSPVRHRLPLRRKAFGPAIVHPGAKDPGRRWPAARFAAVAGRLRARGTEVVITGNSNEIALARRVAEQAGLAPSRVLAGATDTAALAALVARAPVVISGDTGIAHLATACRTPSVVLFGALGPHLWGPPPDRPWHRALWRPMPGDQAVPTGAGEPAVPTGAGEPAVPAATAPHPALLRITEDEVVQAAQEVRRMR